MRVNDIELVTRKDKRKDKVMIKFPEPKQPTGTHVVPDDTVKLMEECGCNDAMIAHNVLRSWSEP